MFLKRINIVIVSFITIIHAEVAQTVPVEIFWIWVALFVLAGVGVFILFISSQQAKSIQKMHQNVLEKQLEMEKNQNLLLTNMSENIRQITTEALERRHKVRHTSSTPLIDQEDFLSNFENELLDVTNDLIDFLKLKSKRIEIANEEFNINNVLNEISGSICSIFSGRETELIFDIDKSIPRRLIGDSLHLGQVLKSILEYLMDQSNVDEVKLDIAMFDNYEEIMELQFKFTDTGDGIPIETLDQIFIPYYDEHTNTYIGLGLFVANQLISMMGGEISVQSMVGKGNIFIISLPFQMIDKEDQRKYRLPDRILIEKKVFIVDSNYNSALSIKKMFAYFKHEVKVVSKEEFIRERPNLEIFDIIVINEHLFNVSLIDYITEIKRYNKIKVIALNSLMKSSKNNFINDIIDIYLFKPLNQERIFEMIINMYNIHSSNIQMHKHDKKVITQKTDIQTENIAQSKKLLIHNREDIIESKNITRESFKSFSKKSILIVEDNIINQKVITNVLKLSDIKITIANNGEEAVDFVKDKKLNFDLVLMDINMPIMDGYTATEMIRRDDKFKNLPIIAFTALVLDSEIRKMFNSGINAFLAKPLNVGKLYTVLNIYLGAKIEIKIDDENYRIEQPKQDLSSYDGIDINKGIEYANNSEALYVELLKEFITAYSNSNELFSKLIEEHRYEQVKMLCLDMRGITGTIAAYTMHKLMSEILQQLLYKKYELLTNYREQYLEELTILNHSIRQYISASN